MIDDPVKDRAEADSESMREATWKWYGEVARTRLMGKGQQILTMTRWHEDDLAGRILNSPGSGSWEVLRLPALAEESDLLGRTLGSPLWPEMYDAATLLDLKATMSERAWQSLYQQNPIAEGGNVILDDWWQRYDHILPQFARVEQTVDAAFKEGTRSDYSVIATWGATRQGEYYLLGLWRDRVDFPHLLAAIYRVNAQAKKDWSMSVPVVIEDAASGQSAIQTLKSAGRAGLQRLNVIAWPEQTRAKHDQIYRRLRNSSKIARLEGEPIKALEAEKVYIPRKTPVDWKGVTVEEFLAEHAAFPSGAHDDMVDTTIMALWRFSRGVASGPISKPYTRTVELVPRS